MKGSTGLACLAILLGRLSNVESACMAKIKKPSERDCVHQPSRPGFVGEGLAIDLVGPVNPESPEGYKYILTAQDTFTSYSYASQKQRG